MHGRVFIRYVSILYLLICRRVESSVTIFLLSLNDKEPIIFVCFSATRMCLNIIFHVSVWRAIPNSRDPNVLQLAPPRRHRSSPYDLYNVHRNHSMLEQMISKNRHVFFSPHCFSQFPSKILLFDN